MGSAVGGVAGLLARLTGSLHSIVQKLTNALHEGEGGGGGAGAGDGRIGQTRGQALAPGTALTDVRRGLHLSLKEAFKEEGKEALRSLSRVLKGLLRGTLQGHHEHGTMGLARGLADGVINIVLLPIVATLETGAIVTVPMFIETGELIKVDTREDRYISRASGDA